MLGDTSIRQGVRALGIHMAVLSTVETLCVLQRDHRLPDTFAYHDCYCGFEGGGLSAGGDHLGDGRLRVLGKGPEYLLGVGVGVGHGHFS